MQVLLPVYICIFRIVTDHQPYCLERRRMKKVYFRSLVAVVMIISFISFHSIKIAATEKASDDLQISKEISDDDFIDYLNKPVQGDLQSFPKMDKLPGESTHNKAIINKDAIDKSIRYDNLNPNNIKSRDTNDNIVIYGDKITGYLTTGGDYALYPASLYTGQYLQVRLTQPNNANIDYDMYLLDEDFYIIKSSEYYTFMSGTVGTVPESIGYIADSDETVYVYILAATGYSSTDSFTLEYTIGENNYDSGEPDENPQELTQLAFTNSQATASRTICSPIDNDWYSFTVLDAPEYSKMRFSITSSSSVNGCSFEIYENIASSGYALHRRAAGTSGEMALEPDTYYLRVISSNTLTDFDVTDIPTYSLKVLPVAVVDTIEILNYTSQNYVTYNEGSHHRVEHDPLLGADKVGVRCRAKYSEPSGLQHPSPNVIIACTVENPEWTILNRPDLAITHGNNTTGGDGICTIFVYMNLGIGAEHYDAPISRHYYDYMTLDLGDIDNNATLTDHFYYLIRSVG